MQVLTSQMWDVGHIRTPLVFLPFSSKCVDGFRLGWLSPWPTYTKALEQNALGSHGPGGGQEFFGWKLEVRSSFAVHPTLTPTDCVPIPVPILPRFFSTAKARVAPGSKAWFMGSSMGGETLPVTLSQSLNQNLFTHHSLLFTNKSSPVPL